MRFHLNYTPPNPGFEIDHHHKVFLAGSCFSENIGNILKENRFKIYTSPSGITFNPLSVFNTLNELVLAKPIDEKFILERDGIFFSYLHHSSIHSEDKRDLIKKINSENKSAATFLKNADYLIITFGSAFVYHHLTLDDVVANCHKQPNSIFRKSLLSVEKIISAYSLLINSLLVFNPGLKIIFTVSPVKYLKDGITENNLSKSTLLLSIHELISGHKNCFYFPAYELLTDDLRDYRFYKEDLAHPNEQAIEYIWQKFSETFFSEQTGQLNQEIRKLNKALSHRKLIANSTEALKLNDFIIKQKETIKKLNPTIDL